MYKISYFFNHVKHLLKGADITPQNRPIFLTTNGRTTVILL